MINFKAGIKRLLKLIDAGLQDGAGEGDSPGMFCVQQAVNYTYLKNKNDQPFQCVHSELINLGISLNDAYGWSSDKARAKGLREFAVAELGSNTVNCTGFSNKLFLKWRAKHSSEDWNISDKSISEYASMAVELLKELKSPGCEYLGMCKTERIKKAKKEIKRQDKIWASSLYGKPVQTNKELA